MSIMENPLVHFSPTIEQTDHRNLGRYDDEDANNYKSHNAFMILITGVQYEGGY